MNPMVKTALTLALVLPLAGCWDCWSAKKNNDVQSEVATHGHAGDKNSNKCSHKGCTHDHSKDSHKKHADHDEVEVQNMNDDNMDDDNLDMDMDNMDDNEDYSA
ncbi:MAG: hypothetical protein Q8Q60_04165 [Candidatus Chromulinivorax sp.]|nr:hypothetical protein [Candidatus Chromulinivorax sp.]